MELGIKDKIAIVTGGGEGIGRAIALRLANEGATVVVADMNKKGAQSTVAEITDRGGNGMALQVDATKEEDVDRMLIETLEAYKTVDILVNNVGGGGPSTFVTKLSTQVWDQTIEVNLKSTFLCSRAVSRKMMDKNQGRIINIASISGKVGEALVGAYCTAKFGVLGLTQVLAKELGRYSITVNAVCPGYVYTPG
ncbi:MAG: SDR family oxidoreductase, partial [Deltaproteobacteria bacterium]|nr:SDR family oxidoreductase [Deltaproteobacteria bacterium]